MNTPLVEAIVNGKLDYLARVELDHQKIDSPISIEPNTLRLADGLTDNVTIPDRLEELPLLVLALLYRRDDFCLRLLEAGANPYVSFSIYRNALDLALVLGTSDRVLGRLVKGCKNSTEAIEGALRSFMVESNPERYFTLAEMVSEEQWRHIPIDRHALAAAVRFDRMDKFIEWRERGFPLPHHISGDNTPLAYATQFLISPEFFEYLLCHSPEEDRTHLDSYGLSPLFNLVIMLGIQLQSARRKQPEELHRLLHNALTAISLLNQAGVNLNEEYDPVKPSPNETNLPVATPRCVPSQKSVRAHGYLKSHHVTHRYDTPLMVAARNFWHVALFEFLVMAGLDPEYRSSRHQQSAMKIFKTQAISKERLRHACSHQNLDSIMGLKDGHYPDIELDEEYESCEYISSDDEPASPCSYSPRLHRPLKNVPSVNESRVEQVTDSSPPSLT